MNNSLSIRSYSKQRRGHAHTFNQLVLPLRGVINLELDGYSGKVVPGECAIIKSGITHHFTANEEARFVVADMSVLPDNLKQTSAAIFSITPPLFSYLHFIEQQLEHQINSSLELVMNQTFELLLHEQKLFRQVDQRIRAVQGYIADHLAEKLAIDELAAIACLSPTQFKKVFKQQLDSSVMQYITAERMEKAKALLVHTDYPVQLVAEQVGYQDQSAFSRRFSEYYGMSPRDISH